MREVICSPPCYIESLRKYTGWCANDSTTYGYPQDAVIPYVASMAKVALESEDRLGLGERMSILELKTGTNPYYAEVGRKGPSCFRPAVAGQYPFCRAFYMLVRAFRSTPTASHWRRLPTTTRLSRSCVGRGVERTPSAQNEIRENKIKHSRFQVSAQHTVDSTHSY